MVLYDVNEKVSQEQSEKKRDQRAKIKKKHTAIESGRERKINYRRIVGGRHGGVRFRESNDILSGAVCTLTTSRGIKTLTHLKRPSGLLRRPERVDPRASSLLTHDPLESSFHLPQSPYPPENVFSSSLRDVRSLRHHPCSSSVLFFFSFTHFFSPSSRVFSMTLFSSAPLARLDSFCLYEKEVLISFPLSIQQMPIYNYF